MRAILFSLILFFMSTPFAKAETANQGLSVENTEAVSPTATPTHLADIMQLQLTGMPAPGRDMNSSNGSAFFNLDSLSQGFSSFSLNDLSRRIGRFFGVESQTETTRQQVADTLKVEQAAQSLIEQKKTKDFLEKQIGQKFAHEKASMLMIKARLAQAKTRFAALDRKNSGEESAKQAALQELQKNKLATIIETLQKQQTRKLEKMADLQNQMSDLGVDQNLSEEISRDSLNPVVSQSQGLDTGAEKIPASASIPEAAQPEELTPDPDPSTQPPKGASRQPASL